MSTAAGHPGDGRGGRALGRRRRDGHLAAGLRVPLTADTVTVSLAPLGVTGLALFLTYARRKRFATTSVAAWAAGTVTYALCATAVAAIAGSAPGWMLATAPLAGLCMGGLGMALGILRARTPRRPPSSASGRRRWPARSPASTWCRRRCGSDCGAERWPSRCSSVVGRFWWRRGRWPDAPRRRTSSPPSNPAGPAGSCSPSRSWHCCRTWCCGRSPGSPGQVSPSARGQLHAVRHDLPDRCPPSRSSARCRGRTGPTRSAPGHRCWWSCAGWWRACSSWRRLEPSLVRWSDVGWVLGGIVRDPGRRHAARAVDGGGCRWSGPAGRRRRERAADGRPRGRGGRWGSGRGAARRQAGRRRPGRARCGTGPRRLAGTRELAVDLLHDDGSGATAPDGPRPPGRREPSPTDRSLRIRGIRRIRRTGT